MIEFDSYQFDLDEERDRYAERNYCEYGHCEEFDLDDPTWPRCKNEAYLRKEDGKWQKSQQYP